MQIRIYTKRLCFIFLASLAVLIMRLYDNGLCSLLREGRFSYFDGHDNQVHAVQPLLCPAEYQRVDLPAATEIEEVLNKTHATVVFSETVQGVILYYAYSPLIYRSVSLPEGLVNITIAKSERGVAVGCPLLKGSY